MLRALVLCLLALYLAGCYVKPVDISQHPPFTDSADSFVYDDDFVETENADIEFTGPNETILLLIKNNRVIDGYAQGRSHSWETWGGVKTGNRIQALFVRRDLPPGNPQWWSHTYRISGKDVILETSVNHTGEAITDRNVRYSLTRYKKRNN